MSRRSERGQLIPDTDDPYGIVALLVEAVASGSWLAVLHPASDIHPEQIADATRRLSARSAGTTTLRTRAEAPGSSTGWSCSSPGWCKSTGGSPARRHLTAASRSPATPGWPASPNRRAPDAAPPAVTLYPSGPRRSAS